MLTLAGYVVKNLGRQKLRTALSVLGVMLGVWMVVLFAAFSDGMVRTAESMLTEFGETSSVLIWFARIPPADFTLLQVTHDPSVAERADRVLTMLDKAGRDAAPPEWSSDFQTGP